MMSESTTPSAALMALLAPDGYYQVLRVSKETALPDTNKLRPPSTSATATVVDADAVKKSYRQLSRKYHPDKPGGDPETFRRLHRAQKVLLDAKLRAQYDMLGLDLEDEAGEGADGDKEADNASESNGNKQSSSGKDTSSPNGIVHEMAGMVLSGIMQMVVRTVVIGLTNVLICAYLWTVLPSLLFLAHIAFTPGSSHSRTLAIAIPVVMGAGLLLMYSGRTQQFTWGYRFWAGEGMVMATMGCNHLAVSGVPLTKLVLAALAVVSLLATLWLRGKLWRYIAVVVLELLLALIVALAFPIMELILEAILDEKLRKVGDKVRMQHKLMERYYEAQLEGAQHTSTSKTRPRRID